MVALIVVFAFLIAVGLLSRVRVRLEYSLEGDVERLLVVTKGFGMTWRYSKLSFMPGIGSHILGFLGGRTRDTIELGLERLAEIRRGGKLAGGARASSGVHPSPGKAIRAARFTLGLFGFVVGALARRGRFEELDLRVEYGSGDAAGTAIAIGVMHAIAQPFIAYLSGGRKIGRGNVEFAPCFDAVRVLARIRARFSFTVLDVVLGTIGYMLIRIEASFRERNCWGKLAMPGG